jgi:1-acyl-sn-glycerol-3-phosphate acyltransferase
LATNPQPRLPRWFGLPYAVYAILLFAVLAVGVLLLTLPLPWQSVRRKMVRGAAKLFLLLAGMRITVLHLERLPAEACVVVANHSSYLDGIVLFAALPPVFGFVIKREMSRVPLANLLLRQIGAHFVDRGQGTKGARDTRKLLKQAASGGSLAFFPEGTFNSTPGLMRFRAGAFLVAARSGFPVLPVAIRGSRQALPPGGFLPNPGSIEIEVTTPIPAPASTDEADTSAVRRAARRAILASTHEPDLAPEDLA